MTTKVNITDQSLEVITDVETGEVLSQADRGWVSIEGLVEISLDDAVEDHSTSSVPEYAIEFLQATEKADTERTDLEDNESSDSNPTIHDMVEVLRSNVTDLSTIDPRLERRVKDFQFAQSQRHYSFCLFGILGLFFNLSDIRADLRWAEEAAWRRENGKTYIGWDEYEAKREKRLRRPYFTYCLLLSHVVLLILLFRANGWKMEPMKVNPFAGPSSDSLLKLGALNTGEMLDTASWYRLVTATFLHAGIIHLAVNAAALAFYGRHVELNHGIVATCFLFFVPAVGGNVISALMQPGYTLVGASGGIFALMGACIADAMLNWKLMFLVFKDRPGMSGCWTKFLCMFWLVVEVSSHLLVGFTPYGDNFAHLGGLIYGFLGGLTILERLPHSFFGKRNCFHAFRITLYRISAAIFAIALLVASTLWLTQSDGVTVPCQSCRYVSCVPFPFWTDDKWWTCDARDGCDLVHADLYKTEDGSFYAEIELFCPDSTSVREDISEHEYTENDMQVIRESLSDLCRSLC
eukprot:scaffold7316_cov123-Cylindrotheca_fusiformis.AAC.15